jgi:phosphatidylserine/phosphatidylglycerophosphate/cardiolipin synthase-like enzyme
MRWDPMTLMWIQVATGFMGALTLVCLARFVGRRLGLLLDIKAYFSPAGGGRDALLRVLNKARREVLIQAYSFSDEPLLAALVEAKKRGVAVEVLLDAHHEKVRTTDFAFLVAQGIDPFLDTEARVNAQTVIVDGKVVVVGSYDYTPQAETDYVQTLVVIRRHAELVQQFRAEFQKHKAHAKPSQKKEEEKLRIAA